MKYKNKMEEAVINNFLENQKKLFMTALVITKNYHDAEDAVQETFIKVKRQYKSVKHSEYIKTWITRILINQCKDMLRCNKNYILNMDILINKYFIEFNDQELVFFDLISNLDTDDREIVTLRFFHSLKLDEISEILNIPISTTKTRLYRAIEKLKKNWS